MKAYYGWYVVAVGMAVLTLVVGATIHAFGLFVLPVSRDFGLSRAEINTGVILLNFGMAVVSPIIGRILDRRSARMVTVVSALFFAASLMMLGLSHDLRLSAFVMAVPLAIAVVGSGTLTSTTLVARWFAVQRGRAMALAAIGISLGPLLVIPLISVMIGGFGWRQTLIALGLGIGALLLVLSTFLRERPRVDEVEPGAAASPMPSEPKGAQAALGVKQLLGMPEFWTLALGAAFAFGIQQATLVSLVPFAQGHGYSVTQGATLFSMFGGMAILGKLLLAWVGDRFDRLWLLTALFALLAATNGALMLAQGYAAILACSALLGLASGATTPGFLALIADRFGPASFGTVSGSASFVSTVITAACIRYGGEVFDRTGSYRLMFLSFLVLGIAAALLMLATGRLLRRRAAGATG